MKQWRYIPAVAAAVPLALAMSFSVQAQSADGYLNDDVTLRAGPALEYPDIEGLPYGTYVSVQGCTEDWEWCDVIAEQGDRGWVPGDYIDYVYEGQPELVTEYGPRIGIPIVTFSITNYWNTHYHDRPFYRERSTWFHRDIPHRAPPPPRHASAHRAPPPPPPGGWHHGGHASQPRHQAGAAAPTHHESTSYHGSTASPSPHERASSPSHYESTSHHESTPQHERASSPPPRPPVNQPEHPRGDHHATIRTPPVGASQQHGNAHAPPHSHAEPHPQYPASGASHGKRPPEPQKHKKDDHDHGDDNGH